MAMPSHLIGTLPDYCTLRLTRRQMEAVADAMVLGGVLGLSPKNPRRVAYEHVLKALAWRIGDDR